MWFAAHSPNLDTVFYDVVAANRKFKVEYVVGSFRVPGEQPFGKHTMFYVPRFDTTAIEILY